MIHLVVMEGDGIGPEISDATVLVLEVLNSKLGQWGSFGYEKVKDQDVLTTTVPVKNLDKVAEQFTITIKDKELLMEWDKTGVAVPVKF